jgi:hypothetical protein
MMREMGALFISTLFFVAAVPTQQRITPIRAGK